MRPLTQRVINRHKKSLTQYEQSEIKKFKRRGVFFLGKNAEKLKLFNQRKPNFESKRGYYKFLLHDHINYRYEILDRIGRGVSSEVVKAYDHRNGKTVAIKIAIRNTKSNLALELHVLSNLRRLHKNKQKYILRVYNRFFFRNHYCMVTELVGPDLETYLEIPRHENGIPINEFKMILRSFLRGLCILHEHRLVHADVKSSNVALVKNGSQNVKILDFGWCHQVGAFKMTPYMQARSYRAPEVILRMDYGCPIDMWSTGVMIVELALNGAIFVGDSAVDELGAIIEVLGLPPKSMLESSPMWNLLIDSNGQPKSRYRWYHNRMDPGQNNIALFFKSLSNSVDPDLLDLVTKLLIWDPKIRLTAHQALQHKFLSTKNRTVDKNIPALKEDVLPVEDKIIPDEKNVPLETENALTVQKSAMPVAESVMPNVVIIKSGEECEQAKCAMTAEASLTVGEECVSTESACDSTTMTCEGGSTCETCCEDCSTCSTCEESIKSQEETVTEGSVKSDEESSRKM